MMDDCFCELTKFVQMMCADLIDDFPVDRLIADDVLNIRVSKEVIHGGRSLLGDPVDATPERFQFRFD